MRLGWVGEEGTVYLIRNLHPWLFLPNDMLGWGQ